jgi:uncharacterized protein YbjQ (UPF0145 family)
MANKCAVCGEPFSWKDRGNKFDFYDLGVKTEHSQTMCPDCFNLLISIKNGKAADAEFQKIEAYLHDRNDEDLNHNYELLKEQCEERAKAVQVIQAEHEKTDKLMITSGSGFEGFRITDYIDYIVFETTTGLELYKGKAASFAAFLGSEASSLQSKLIKAREFAISGLKSEAQDKGATAIIGMDIGYTMFGDSIVGVIAKGTAVITEKTE